MKNAKKNTTMTAEAVLQDAALDHFHEAILFIKDKPNKDIFPN